MSVHEGIKYECDHCNYKASYQSSLKTHKMTVHEGIKYECDHCHYKANHRNSLKKHSITFHEGIKYECDKNVSSYRYQNECGQCYSKT